MSHIVFRNRGTLDPRSITTFGTSSKTSTNAIGYFGTGLKYAIAVILRLGGKIAIYSDGKAYEFSSRKTRIRVDDFDVVTMNRRALGFTTELGKNWEGWMAFRELWCNARDEGGEVLFTTTPNSYASGLIPFRDETTEQSPKGRTVVVVSGDAIMDAWAAKDSICLATEPLWTLPGLAVHPGRSQFVYYRGVRIAELPKPAEFTYNILAKVDLTEDRTAKYPWMVNNVIAQNLVKLDRSDTLQHLLTLPKEAYESGLDYGGHQPSDAFSAVVGTLARSFNPHLNESAFKVVRLLNTAALMEKGEGLSLDPVESQQLARAVAFCHSLGYTVDDYPIVPLEYIGEGVWGRADVANQRIYLARSAFRTGTKTVAGTLIEEYLHIKHHLEDESRAMQNFLLDALVSLGERLRNQPL